MGNKLRARNGGFALWPDDVSFPQSKGSKRMKNWMVTVAGAAVLAACGSGGDADADGDGTISMAEAAEETRDAGIRPQPGQWRATMEVQEIEGANVPAGAADMMKQMMARSFEYCMTQEDADKGFEEMAKQSQDESCTFERYDIDGGELDAVMVCKGQEGGSVRMTIDGTGTETSSEMLMTMEGAIPGQGEGRMVMKTSHQRIGECPG